MQTGRRAATTVGLLDTPRSILDPLHGLIRLTTQELEMVDHRLFQRMRSIRQNGLLHLIFPSATHTRFEHSLGALHTATAVFDALIRNSATAAQKGIPAVRKVAAAEDGEAIDFSEVDCLPQILRLLRFAALTHDIGHGPLSHTFDSFAPTKEHLGGWATGSGGEASAIISAIAEKLAPKQRLKHEQMSCIMFSLIADAGGNGIQPEDVRALPAILLGPDYDGLASGQRLDVWLPLIRDILTSPPADADRMDYLERDSLSFGVTYGLFDRNRLLKSFLCYKEGNHFRLGIKRSGLRAAENFLQARYELFVQVYYHKTNRALGLMLQRIARSAESENIFEGVSDTTALEQRYVDLSDEQFLRELEQLPGEIPAMSRAIRDRQLWKRVTDCYSSDESERVTERLKGIHPELDLFADTVEAKATDKLETGAPLLVRDQRGVYSIKSVRGWLEESKIMAALRAEDRVSRVYLRSDDSKTASKLRNLVAKMREDGQLEKNS